MRRALDEWGAGVKHAGSEALDRIPGLLDALRALPVLKEQRPGVFYLRSKAFVHFHEDGADVYADVRPAGEASFSRLKVTGVTGQRQLLRIARKACR
jgi:hypothetical protein